MGPTCVGTHTEGKACSMCKFHVHVHLAIPASLTRGCTQHPSIPRYLKQKELIIIIIFLNMWPPQSCLRVCICSRFLISPSERYILKHDLSLKYMGNVSNTGNSDEWFMQYNDFTIYNYLNYIIIKLFFFQIVTQRKG